MRRIISITLALFLLIGTFPLLGACHTAAGAGEDISATGKAMTNSAEKHFTLGAGALPDKFLNTWDGHFGQAPVRPTLSSPLPANPASITMIKNQMIWTGTELSAPADR